MWVWQHKMVTQRRACCAHRCAPQGGSGTGAVGKPVNTVVDAQSATAVRGSPAADPVLGASADLLDTPART